jgi:hypothetical protein
MWKCCLLWFKEINRIRTEFQERSSWFLSHDNARHHIEASIQQFLAKQVIPELNHRPNSPDLSPSDFFFFPKIISTLKERRFEDAEDIKRYVTEELLALKFIQLIPTIL